MRLKLPTSLLIALLSISTALAEAPGKSLVTWRPWNDNVFQEAKTAKKLILLNMEAVWCHWCHVMDEKTYSNSDVAGILNASFITLRVDQDSRPDLSNRYREYGWPATIVLNGSGKELAKMAGFVEPSEFASILRNAVANPDKEMSGSQVRVGAEAPSSLSPELKKKLVDRFFSTTDEKIGGLKIAQRFLDGDTIEYGLTLAERGDENAEKAKEIALLTLRSNRKLFDPVWGGVYQYSTHYGWDKPHYEKIMSTQTTNLRMYSLAARLNGDADFRAATENIIGYLSSFLFSPMGAFYTSQDADVVKGQHSGEFFALSDRDRRRVGIPRIDTHIYSRENGWAIEALANNFVYVGDEGALRLARQSAEWVLKNRSLPNGGFRHDEKDVGGPYLGDTLGMGRGLLALYAVTGERDWLNHAVSAGKFLTANFIEKENGKEVPGFLTSAPVPGAVLKPIRQIDENISATRFLNLLAHYSGEKSFKDGAANGMKYLAVESVALDRLTETGILLADEELSVDPLHLTIVGGKGDEAAKALFRAAAGFPVTYKRVEWWDRSEGPLLHADVEYPQMPKAAAFVCTSKRCSLPIFEPSGIEKTIAQFRKQ